MALTKQQLKARRNWIGASDVSTILGLNPYESPMKPWAEKTGRLPIDETTGKTQAAGHKLEPVLLDMAEERLGGPLERNVEVAHQRSSVPIVATLDAAVDRVRPVEAKTYGLFNKFADISIWGPDGSDKIPIWYRVQVQTQMACSGGDVAYMEALIGGRGFAHFEIPRHDESIRLIEEHLDRWWKEHVLADVPPQPDDRSRKVLKEFIRKEGLEHEFTEDDWELWERRNALKKQIKDLEVEVAKAESQLLTKMDQAEIGVFPNGSAMTYFQISKKGHWRKPSTYRQIGYRKKWRPENAG